MMMMRMRINKKRHLKKNLIWLVGTWCCPCNRLILIMMRLHIIIIWWQDVHWKLRRADDGKRLWCDVDVMIWCLLSYINILRLKGVGWYKWSLCVMLMISMIVKIGWSWSRWIYVLTRVVILRLFVVGTGLVW